MMIISYLGRWEYPWFYFTLTFELDDVMQSIEVGHTVSSFG